MFFENYKKRNSNIEILRIIAMFFVIFHHAISQGFSFYSMPESGINTYFYQSFNCLGWIGNMFFIMISGYYLYQSKFSLKKVVSIWLQLFFYSSVISIFLFLFRIDIYGITGDGFLLTRLVEKRPFKITELFFSFIPFLTAQNWYATKYIVFLFFVPFLNVIVDNVSRIIHFLLVIFLFIIFEFLPLFTWFDVYEINNYTPFFLLFFAGSFLKKYQPEIIKNNSCLILCLGIAYFLIFIGLRYYAMSVYKTLDNVPFVIYTFLMSSHAQDFVLTTCSFLIFSGCVYLSVKSNFFINLIASTTFGIYLLHNHNYFRRNIWFDFFKLNNHFSDNNLILYMIFCVSAVFAVCCIIELLRQMLFGRLFDVTVSHISNVLLQLFEKQKKKN